MRISPINTGQKPRIFRGLGNPVERQAARLDNLHSHSAVMFDQALNSGASQGMLWSLIAGTFGVSGGTHAGLIP